MKQRTLAAQSGFERYTKKTRRAEFLEEMEQVVPWAELCALIEPVYPKAGPRASAGGGGADAAPCIFCSSGSDVRTRRWKKRCMSRCRCGICGHQIWGASRCRTRRRVQVSATYWSKHQLGARIFERVQEALTRAGAADRDGNDRGCDDCARSEFDQERAPGARPEMHQTARGSSWVLRDEGAVGVDSKSKLIHAVVATPAQCGGFARAAGFAAQRRDAGVGDQAYADRAACWRVRAAGNKTSPASATIIRIGWMK